MLPYSYKEYLDITNNKNTLDNFNNYAGVNAFPGELTNKHSNAKDFKKVYLLNYLYNDMVQYEPNINKEYIDELVQFFYNNNQGEISINKVLTNIELGEGTSRNTKYKTIKKYINLLEDYNVIKIVRRYDYDHNKLNSVKIYMNPHLYLVLNDVHFDTLSKGKQGLFTESLLTFYANFDYGYLKTKHSYVPYSGHEIDFITENDSWFEIKSTWDKNKAWKSVSNLFKDKTHKNNRFILYYGKTLHDKKQNVHWISILELLATETKVADIHKLCKCYNK